MTPARDLHPEFEPKVTGMLDLSDGNHMFWQDGRLRSGIAALIVHGVADQPMRTAVLDATDRIADRVGGTT